MSKPYYTVEDIAEMLEVSTDTVRNWIKQKLLPAIRLSKDYRIAAADLEKFLKDRRTDNEVEP